MDEEQPMSDDGTFNEPAHFDIDDGPVTVTKFVEVEEDDNVIDIFKNVGKGYFECECGSCWFHAIVSFDKHMEKVEAYCVSNPTDGPQIKCVHCGKLYP